MRRATSFRKKITALALAAVCALAPGFPVSAEPAAAVEVEQDPAAQEMLAEQDAVDAAAEVADRYGEIIASAGEFAQAEPEEIDALADYADETRAMYEALEPDMQEELAGSTASFENACASIEQMQEMLEQAARGEEIAAPEEDCENSWRYNNGELITDALETVEEERAQITGEEGDGAVPTANIAMVRTRGKTAYMSVAQAKAVQSHATASTEVYLGIDVSSYQGKIDWNAVKNAGIKFAILRIGRVLSGTWRVDSYWERNAAECERVGIPYGTYTYSYASTLDDIENEAEKTIRELKGHKVSLPVFTDIEDDRQIAANAKTPGIINQFAQTFTNKVAAAGYATGLYASSSFIDSYCLSFARSTNHYIWIARYNSGLAGPNADGRYSYKGPYCAWQYSSKGSVAGIKGDVDMNRWYGPLKTSSAGVSSNPIEVDGTLYAIEDGRITYAATGEALSGVNAVRILDPSSSYYSTSAIYYTKDGVIIGTYTGLAQDDFTGTWYYFRNGKVDTSFAGLAKGDRWYYVKNGTIDRTFTGIAQSPKNGKYYAVTKGVIENDTQGIAKNPKDGKWYYVNRAEVDTSFTGLAKSLVDGKWYFVRRGVLDWSFTGLAKSVTNGKYYFARKGKVDWSFTGIAKSITNGKWYFVKKGALNTKFTGVAKRVSNGKWYYVKKGKYNKKYTGLAKSATNGKLYYVKKGRLDWKYSGKVKYNKKWYRVKKGRAKRI